MAEDKFPNDATHIFVNKGKHFPQKIDFGISCKYSPMETNLHEMSKPILWEKQNKKSINDLLSAELALLLPCFRIKVLRIKINRFITNLLIYTCLFLGGLTTRDDVPHGHAHQVTGN